MADDVKPWERQVGEPEQAYDAFKQYCFHIRRIAYASVKYGAAELQALAHEWRWQERALEWDRHIERVRTAEREAFIRNDEKERLAKWMAALETAGALVDREMTKLLHESQKSQMSGLIKPSDLNKLMVTWITMQRLVHGESTENVDVKDARLERLSLDELKELQRIHAKMSEEEDDDPRH